MSPRTVKRTLARKTATSQKPRSSQEASYFHRILVPGMVFPLGVTLELRTVEVDFPQLACAVSLRLVVEVRRRWIAAFSSGRYRFCPHSLTELNDGHEAVAARSVDLL